MMEGEEATLAWNVNNSKVEKDFQMPVHLHFTSIRGAGLNNELYIEPKSNVFQLTLRMSEYQVQIMTTYSCPGSSVGRALGF